MCFNSVQWVVHTVKQERCCLHKPKRCRKRPCYVELVHQHVWRMPNISQQLVDVSGCDFACTGLFPVFVCCTVKRGVVFYLPTWQMQYVVCESICLCPPLSKKLHWAGDILLFSILLWCFHMESDILLLVGCVAVPILHAQSQSNPVVAGSSLALGGRSGCRMSTTMLFLNTVQALVCTGLCQWWHQEQVVPCVQEPDTEGSEAGLLDPSQIILIWIK